MNHKQHIEDAIHDLTMALVKLDNVRGGILLLDEIINIKAMIEDLQIKAGI